MHSLGPELLGQPSRLLLLILESHNLGPLQSRTQLSWSALRQEVVKGRLTSVLMVSSF